ncbi:hypothetical protein H5410_060276 [Solanum commersonii]|uniref:Uncharacterized protein n=1 Tax=Solanum commersonii TaxID=4109 RepID=A0A9J5W619_SOLCO|nr:hypothetical protein H5410_060276 [Solanum commersonii]
MNLQRIVRVLCNQRNIVSFLRQHINRKGGADRKARYLPIEEALVLTSRIKKYGSPINTVSSRLVSTKSIKFSKPKAKLIYFYSSIQFDVAYASAILEHRTPDVVNESRMINSPMTHHCDHALVPSWKYCILGYWEAAPVDWCCEECDIRKGVMFSPRGLKESKLHESTKNCQSTVQPKKHSKFPRRQHINWEKEVRTGKTRYLPIEEALVLSSRIKKYGSPPINTVSSRLVSTKSIKFSKPKAKLIYFYSSIQFDVAYASAILEHRTPDVVNESRMINSPMTHHCDHALVPSWKYPS